MNSPIFSFFLLIPLFYLLSKTSDYVILKIRILANKIGLGIGALGALLGLLTTIPEMSVGFNAVALGQSGLSIGNLLGGIIVLFCLVLGVSLILNRGIKTDGKILGLIPFSVFLLLPILLGTKGYLGFWDGILMVIMYILILRYKFIGENAEKGKSKIFKIETLFAWREFVHLFAGALGIVVVSNLIVRVGVSIVEVLNIPPFLMGVVVFSLGTNLPEIAVMLKAWHQNMSDLSLSNLLGSAAANILVVGIIVMLKEVPMALGNSFYFTLISLLVVIPSFLFFYRSGKELTKKEGYILVSFYLIFIIGQSIFS